MVHTPNIFVTRKGQQVYSCEVGVNGHKVERQQDRQDFHDQPHKRWACLNSQQLWGKPEGGIRKKRYPWIEAGKIYDNAFIEIPH